MLILIGHNDTQYLGAGWHPIQSGPAGIPCRWTSPRAQVLLPPECMSAQKDGDVYLTITVSAPAKMQGHKPGLAIYIDDVFCGHVPDLGDEGHWATIIYSFAPPNGGGASTEKFTLTLATETHDTSAPRLLAFIPHEELPDNSDLRELGVLISSLRIE